MAPQALREFSRRDGLLAIVLLACVALVLVAINRLATPRSSQPDSGLSTNTCTSALVAGPERSIAPPVTATPRTDEPTRIGSAALTSAPYMEVPALDGLRCWSNGSTMIFVKEGRIVEAVAVGSTIALPSLPPPGTALFKANGTLVGWIGSDEDRPLDARSLRLPQMAAHGSLLRQTPVRSAYSGPGIAENGSYYGQISRVNGLPRTHYINGYFRRDGTYVRSYYRSR